MPDRENLKPARVFLALWPTDEVRKRLAEEGNRLHGLLSGRVSRPDTLHLTLVFIGDLKRTRLPELCEQLRAVSSSNFQLELDLADCWRHNRIAYLMPSKPPSVLFELVTVLENTLDTLAIPFDRRPYKPHVTLLRKADCQKGNPASGRVSTSPEWRDLAAMTWAAKDFVLVESVPAINGAHYQILEQFPLS
jgi:2'-5' RNA ligase